MKRLKILLVEDNDKTIAHVKKLFAEHDLVIATSVIELTDWFRDNRGVKPDAVLTDINIPLGDKGTDYDVKKCFEPNQTFPAGLVAVIYALTHDIPCVIVTDGNGHEDVYSLLLENLPHYDRRVKRLFIASRADVIDGVKDYTRAHWWLNRVLGQET